MCRMSRAITKYGSCEVTGPELSLLCLSYWSFAGSNTLEKTGARTTADEEIPDAVGETSNGAWNSWEQNILSSQGR